jgi:hypothetical protein
MRRQKVCASEKPGSSWKEPSVVVVSGRSLVGGALAMLLAWTIGADAAHAQGAKPPKPAAASARPSKPAPARTGECAALPGGPAPVQKIAALTTGLSPRDLDLVYFGKPLAELTDEDFAEIAALSKRCSAGPDIVPEDKQPAFQRIVRDAQNLRKSALEKVKRSMTDIATLPIARDKLNRLNELSENLDRLEPVLTRGDIKYTASWIGKQMQGVYDSTPKGEATATRPTLPPLPQAMASAPVSPATPSRVRVPGGEEN